ncbi:serine/threonine-protein kinase [Thaumasiovibrio sp. DFM-14]|uniref:serine/threonine-protein kinase n=1 Tax=Thaumasiovibrio sp. DFM-14 TaxID=3384792 RepID=UPI0039A201C2
MSQAKPQSIQKESDGDKTHIVNSEDNITNNKENISKTEVAGSTNKQPVKLIGQVIKGRYCIESLLGHGGMCDVYKATDRLLEKTGAESPYVALKILQPEFAEQPEVIKSLFREAQNTQQLSHHNIIRIYDFGVDKQIYFLVMEYLDGETLEEVIQRSRPHGLSFKSAYKILQKVLHALDYAHQQNVVHADLKPSNIMLNRNGEVKVFDFGVSKVYQEDTDIYAAKLQQEDSSLSGYTPNYASINLLEGKEASQQDDMFAFNCIAYELLSSRHPFGRKPSNIAKSENYTLTKLAKLPMGIWGALKRGLDLTGNLSPLSAQETIKCFERKTSSYLACGVISLMIMIIAGVSIHHQHTKYQTLVEQVAFYQNEQAQTNAWLAMSPETLLQKHNSISNSNPIISDGLFRQHRKEIIAIFDSRVETILNNRESKFPDYYAIDDVFNDAYELYPDSQALKRLATDIESSWQNTVDVLQQRINMHLEKGNYGDDDKEDNVYVLKDDLTTVRKDLIFSPTTTATDRFVEQYRAAIKNDDVHALTIIITIGELFFANNSDLSELIEFGNRLKSSIFVLNEYNAEIEKGNSIPFPYEAAEVYYFQRFEDLNATLSDDISVAKLDELVRNVDNIATRLPEDFLPLTNLRSNVAEQYMRISDKLSNAKKDRLANQVMRKANQQLALAKNIRSRN